MERIEFKKGTQVFIRALEPSDVTMEYQQWLNDPEITRGLYTGQFPTTRADLEAYVANQKPGGTATAVMFAICETREGKHIGNIKLGAIDWISRTADVGLFIGNKNYHGKGCGTEALGLVMDFARDDLNLHKLWLTVFSDNQPAIRSYRKHGFREEGVQLRQVYRNGQWLDKVFMGKFLEE